jgi:hypothetical protein
MSLTLTETENNFIVSGSLQTHLKFDVGLLKSMYARYN